jgi:site-specific recombinase XerD
MERFEEFLTEPKYLVNVSHKTLVYYNCAFQSWRKYGGEPKQWVTNLREAGLSAISVNTYICAMNACWKWARETANLTYLKEEQKILATFSPAQVNRLVHWKPVKGNETRAHTIALVALDTGMRISELLSLTRQDVDLDNLVLRVHGKGNKQRLVPMSVELRKVLYRYLASTTSRASFARARAQH